MKVSIRLSLLVASALAACAPAPSSPIPANPTVNAFSTADETTFLTPVENPQVGEITPATIPPLETEPASQSGANTPGELYFFILPHQAGQSVQLARLPGACVTKSAACPALESIPAPFAFNFNLTALAWSPDGTQATFAYPDSVSGTPYKLWIFDPFKMTWTPIAQFPFMDPPFWSPDGSWIAVRAQDGKGGENVYVVHPDGTDLKSLNASGNLPVDARPYVMDGWLTDSVILRSALPGKEGTVYLVRASDGHVRRLFDTFLTKAILVPSRDGAWLAYDDYDSQSQKHVIRTIEAGGTIPLNLVGLTGGSLHPIVWSPNGNHLSFAHTTFDAAGNPVAAVYVIGRDGLGLRHVYQGVTVGRLLFSPEGKYLLVEETTSISGGHLFAVNLETLAAHILEAPGLSLDTDWYAPSWRP